MATYDHSTSAATRAADLAQRCQQAKETPTGWQARCPAHDDRSPSLSITAKADRVLLHCHAGCRVEDIVAALNLEMQDLFTGTRPVRQPPPPPKPASGPPRVVAIYPYHDAAGRVRFQVLRLEPGRNGRRKDFKQQRPDGRGGWINNMDGVQRVLFRLPQVLAAVRDGVTIYLCEGEQNALDVIATGLVATTHPGGADKWQADYTATLRGADVVLLEDNDEPGQRHTRKVAPQLHGVVKRLRVLRLPHLPPKGDVSDWLADGGTRTQLEALAVATPVWTPPPTAMEAEAAADTRPRLQLSADLPAMVNTLEAALAAAQPTRLYVHADRLCVLRRHHGTAQATTPGLYIAELSRPHLLDLASRVVRWETYDRRLDAWRHTLPSEKVLEVFLAQGHWPFPTLQGVITAPTLRPDGSVLDQPGYDATTGLYYDPQGVIFPPLPAQPDFCDAQSALNVLREVFCDFLYPDPAYFATVLAALLSLVGRPAIRGNVPLFGITATTRGSGKTLLVDTLALLATGTRAPKWPQTREDEEERKQLLTLALEGDALVCFDNCAAPLGSPPLDLALTAGVVKGRLLGTNTTATVPIHAVFFATGNNLQYRSDLARRVVPIVLDPQMERPEERSGFQHPALLNWVTTARPQLLSAALTLLRAYWQAGCPPQGLTPYGSFEAWSDTIRSAVVWVGEADPCFGRQDLEAASSPEHETHAALLSAWQKCYPDTAVTLKRALATTLAYRASQGTPPNEWDALYDALADCDTRFDGKTLNVKRIGNVLRTWQGQYINGLRFVTAGKDREGYTTWRLEGTPRH